MLFFLIEGFLPQHIELFSSDSGGILEIKRQLSTYIVLTHIQEVAGSIPATPTNIKDLLNAKIRPFLAGLFSIHFMPICNIY